MDFLDILLQAGLVTSALVAYLILFKKQSIKKGNYRQPGWNYPLKLLCARYAVSRWKAQLPDSRADDMPRSGMHEGWDCLTVRASAPDGSTLLLGIRKLCSRQSLAEVVVHVKLSDGSSYKLPQHPDTAVCAWENVEGAWNANGLKIQILEPEVRLRLLYNGLLTKVEDNTTHHVTLNLIWTSASIVVRHPEDWSNELAAQALAIEPWRDNNWPYMLGKWEEGIWLQWGTVQGRFVSYDEDGVIDTSVYLQTRGVRERSWAPHSYQGVRRSVTLTMAARDGTAVQLRCVSYKKVLTECISGSVRFPNSYVSSITSTDLVLSDFCETSTELPRVYTINVSTKNRDVKLVLRINADGGKLFSGVPYQHEVVYRTVIADIDGEAGTGILELGYEPTVISEPTQISPPRLLKWLTEKEAGQVGYCLPFEERAARCPNYVGGKGASLALLASVQNEEGYRVPPGYCLTTRALEKHLQVNPQLKAAIDEIAAANENYEENNFKEKCTKASLLFATTEIARDVKQEILDNLNELRRKALEQNFGPELRFAVRSSAVGEDSEVLSAAGQNETILGCVTDSDVLQGVQKCWGSMFAFTSAYYRRQNGQACACGGGAVVQALANARAAGVLFTRHPAAGHPARLLLTANYGLGESVVSGSVEPDTIIINRGKEGQLTISKLEVGSKYQRVMVAGHGVSMEDVPEADRSRSCLTDSEIMKLAKIGVAQDELWGSGRDIEWAINENEIFLLQARPITSLERWTEEELLHELDFPIMSDDEIISFGNTGEVLPKPLSPLSYDFVAEPLRRGIDALIDTTGTGYDRSIAFTHYRCTMALYNKSLNKPLSNLAASTMKDLILSESQNVLEGKEHLAYDPSIPQKPTKADMNFILSWLLVAVDGFSNNVDFQSIYKKVPKKIDLNIRMIEMAIHGHKVADDHTISTALHRRTPHWSDKIIMIFLMLKSLIISKRKMNQCIEGVNKMNLQKETNNPLELLNVIMNYEEDMDRFVYSHSITTTASTSSQLIAMSVLLEENSDFTPEQCNEISALLSSGDVLSAEVPHSLAKLTRQLEDSGQADAFREQDPKNAFIWLKKNLPQVYLDVCVFLEQHGHRAIMEFDLLTKPWVLAPEEMMKVLQSLRASKDEAQKPKSDADVIASLKTPKKPSTRKALRWIMPLCKRQVRFRESTKAHLILAIHKLRLAFLRLARLLVRRWYLPNHELIFFFRLHELKSYIETRDPALLRKAIQRQQYYPGWCKLKFAEINTGWVAPLEAQGPIVTAGDVKLEAVSVCGGEVVARACVVKDLSEIGQLQQGDVLITHSTDIGWSPYFPLLTGIVTELGGLISHGAVIAREYGLPCIVGAGNATDIFKTGDMVRLSGTRGFLERVQVTQNLEDHNDS